MIELNDIIETDENSDINHYCLTRTSHGAEKGIAPSTRKIRSRFMQILSRGWIRVDAPGVTTEDLSRLEYHHRRRPMFPFEREAAW
ncbi:MAG: hypothetical protein HYR84_13835 [Planctomycetes bacterium]|nr:hypothetical protein [Planctomycetota bacterium]